MPASTSDYFKKVAASTVTALAAPGKAMGATSITVGSTTGYDTDTGIVIAIRQVDSNGALVAGTYTEWSATVTSGTTLAIEAVPVYGSDQVYTAGSTTQVYVPLSAYAHDKVVDGILVHADQDGTLKAGAVDVAGVVADGILTAAKSTTATNIETRGSETIFDHVASGLVWSGDAYGSTRVASMTSGVVYIAGVRVPVSAVTSRTFTASRDTYIDVGADGVVDYNEVTNNNASPALSASHIRIGIIITGASFITNVGSVNQGQEDKVLPIASSIPYAVTDSLGNLICSRDSRRQTLGYRQITADASTTTTANYVQMTGLTCPVIIPTGRKVRVTVFGGTSLNDTGSNTSYFSAWEGVVNSGTQLVEATGYYTVNSQRMPGTIATRTYTPTSTSITFNGGIKAGNGTARLAASATTPAYISVELV